MSEDILELAKAAAEKFKSSDESVNHVFWGYRAAKELLPELIAEVEAKQANNEYLQKMTEEAQQLMQESQLLLCKEANDAEQLRKEVERLRSLTLDQQYMMDDLDKEITAKDARITELEATCNKMTGALSEAGRRQDRLDAAFLKARQCPTCKGEGTIHPIGQPIDSICPKCLGDPESMAREELERIKEEREG